MLFSPKPLSAAVLSPEELKADRRSCLPVGPCGLGKQALYLNSFYFDRRYYIPLSAVERVFKRLAISSGKIYGCIPYFVVRYDGGKEKQCIFKIEEQVDELMERLRQEAPQIPQGKN